MRAVTEPSRVSSGIPGAPRKERLDNRLGESSSTSRDVDAAVRILIVEDEAIIAWELCSLVEEFGYEVCGVSGRASEAVRLAEQAEPHLVLMDVCLARGDDGVTAAAQIKARRQVPVVFCTAFADSHTVARIEAVGAAGLLRKPVFPPELESMLARVLSDSAPS
jgi:CheY-like chemotaxis protein